MAVEPPALRLRSLQLVAAIHRQGSAVGAARELHISPSAVSRALRETERVLAAPLFERGTRGMVCTAPGLMVVNAVEAVRADLWSSLSDEPWMEPEPQPQQRKVDALMRTLSVPLMRCFVACAEFSSETRAARHLGLSQPGVSQHMRAFQRAYGRALIQRTRHGTRLTRDGARVLAPIKRVLDALRVLHEQLGAFKGDGSGRLNLGVLPMASTVLVPEALARLLLRMPRLVVTISDGTYEAMVQQLRHADLDMIIGPLRTEQLAADLQEQALFDESLVAVVGGAHPLASTRQVLTLAQLTAYAWIAPLQNTPARGAFERAFAAAKVPLPPISLQANSPALVRAMLMRSEHVALMSPLQIAEDLHTGALVRLPVPLRGAERRIGIAMRSGFSMPPACAGLLEELLRVVHAALESGTDWPPHIA